MNKKSLTRALLLAGTVAVAGIGAAQADAIFYPDGTMVELGVNGAENLALDTSMDTSVLGAGPAVTKTVVTTVPVTEYVYVQPNINWDHNTAMTQMHSNAHLMHRHASLSDRKGATATFNVPSRAGEVSTMTNGRPNAVTTNDRVVVGSYTIPYSSVSGDPYYVFSY